MNSVERVKSICKERRIAISRLEKDLGFANGYISQLRKGTFPAERLADIADYLSVSSEYLLTGEEKEKSPTEQTLDEGTQKLISAILDLPPEKQKALADAGVKAEDAVFLKAYYDSDDLLPHYDVKFEANGYEYEYEVKASDGAVLEKDVDRERKPVNSAPASDNYISADKAKALAYEHAEVKAADVKFSKAELDRDDLIVHYDVEFVVGKFEYEYEINAESGKVVVSDKEFNG